MSEIPKGKDGAIIEEIPTCGCTGEQLERGETCGQDNCPNRDRPLRHPRFWDGMDDPCGAVPTEEGRIDDRALEMLLAHPEFDRDAYAWFGYEHLGGGIFAASVYSGMNATDPYLWITEGEEDSEFFACVYIGPANGEEAETPFLSAGCDKGELGKEAVRMLTAAKQKVSKP
jgi:hypothetical protein